MDTLPSLPQLLSYAQQQQYGPEDTAAAVKAWQADVTASARPHVKEDQERYWDGVAALDRDITGTLTQLQAAAVDQQGLALLGSPEAYQQFRSVLATSGNDPANMDAPQEWITAAQKLAETAALPQFQIPRHQYGKIGFGPHTLANYSLRDKQDGTGYEAVVFPTGDDGKPTAKPIRVDLPPRQELAERFKAKRDKAGADYDLASSTSGQEGTEPPPEFATSFEGASDAYKIMTSGRESQALHLGLDDALKTNPAFAATIPQNRLEQFTTRPVLGIIRSLAQAGSAATGTGKDDILTQEGSDALDLTTPGNLRSRYEATAAGDPTSVSDMITGGIESAVTVLTPGGAAKVGGKVLSALGASSKAARGIVAAEEMANAAGEVGRLGKMAGTTAYGLFGAESYGSNYAGALQEADAVEQTDPEKAARIRKYAQLTSILKAGIEIGTEKIFPDEAHMAAGRGMAARQLVKIPGHEAVEEFTGAVGQNVVNTIDGQRNQDPLHAAEAGAIGSLPLMGVGAIQHTMRSPSPEVQAPVQVAPDANQPLPGTDDLINPGGNTTPAAPAPQPQAGPQTFTDNSQNPSPTRNAAGPAMEADSPSASLPTSIPGSSPGVAPSLRTIATDGGQTALSFSMPAAEAGTETRPSYIQVAPPANQATLPNHETATSTTTSGTTRNSYRNPRRALESFKVSDARGDRGTQAATPASERTLPHSTLHRILPEISAERLTEGLRGLIKDKDDEHDVYFDHANNRVVKLTKEGQTGAGGRKGLKGYVEQMAQANEIFGDDIAIEGWVHLPGESAPRIVTTQPLYNGRKSTQEEINRYMRHHGFERSMDEAWLHPHSGLLVTDTAPRNFVTDLAGHVHPVDVIISKPTGAALEHYENMVNGQPQPAPPPLAAKQTTTVAAPPPAPKQRLVSTAHAAAAQRLLARAHPGVGTNVRIVRNSAALASERDSYSESDWQNMSQAEGFYDPRTGQTTVLLDNVVPRPGETPMRAVARVMLHERIAHAGLAILRDNDATFAQRWDALVEMIPAHELLDIARTYPDLRDNPAKLAEEWFARQVEDLAGKLPASGSLVARLWQALKDALGKVYQAFSKQSPSAVQKEIQEVINLSRQALASGQTATQANQTGVDFANPYDRRDLPQWVQNRLGTASQPHPFRIKALAARSVLTGSPLPRVLAEMVSQSQNDVAAVRQTAAQIGADLQKAMDSYAKKNGATPGAVADLVNQALTNPTVLLSMADPVLQDRTRRARNYIDQLSTAVAQATGGQLGADILANSGHWMRRSYAACDPAANWNYDTLTKAAASNQQINGQPARAILQNARAYLHAQFPTATAGEMESIMRELTDRDQWTTQLAGGQTGPTVRKETGSLMHRRDIEAPIRALMGEETNPIKRLSASVGFQAQFIARHEQQRAMRDIGLQLGLFSKNQTGVYTKPVGGEAGARNQGWNGFAVDGPNGQRQAIYTTPELLAALQNAQGVLSGEDFGGWMLKALKFIGAEAKLNKVALSPDSWAVNMTGNIVGLLQGGDLIGFKGWQNIARAVAIHNSGHAKAGDVINVAAEALRDQRRAFLARATVAGVADQGFDLRQLEEQLDNRILQFIHSHDTANRLGGAARGAILGQAFGRVGGVTGRAIGGVTGAVAGTLLGSKRITDAQRFIATWTTGNPDRFAKIASLLTNYQIHLEAGMADQQAFELAATKTMDTLPDYGKLPPIVRELSRYGLLGSFIAFQHEVYRNTYHNIRYGVQEIASGNAALMKRGASRLLGSTTVIGMAGWGLQALIQGMTGVGSDPDKDKAYRRALAAPWEQDSVLAFTKLDEQSASFYNTSYLLPQVTVKEILQAVQEGKQWDDKLNNVYKVMADQFANGSVHLDPLLEAITNNRRMGGKVSNAPKGSLEEKLQRMDYLLYATLEPGASTKLDRYVRALQERTRYGRKFSVEEENLRLLGVRQGTYLHEDRVKNRLYQFRQDYESARDYARAAYRANEPGGAETALAKANATIADIGQRYAEWTADLETLGIPKRMVEAQRKALNVPNKFAPMINTPTGPAFPTKRPKTTRPASK